MDWHLPDQEATTVAGLVIHEARSIPERGQSFTFHGFRFRVLRRERTGSPHSESWRSARGRGRGEEAERRDVILTPGFAKEAARRPRFYRRLRRALFIFLQPCFSSQRSVIFVHATPTKALRLRRGLPMSTIAIAGDLKTHTRAEVSDAGRSVHSAWSMATSEPVRSTP